jgi:hypothetical protein
MLLFKNVQECVVRVRCVCGACVVRVWCACGARDVLVVHVWWHVASSVFVILILYKPSTVDLVSYGSHAEDEKERLLQNVWLHLGSFFYYFILLFYYLFLCGLFYFSLLLILF